MKVEIARRLDLTGLPVQIYLEHRGSELSTFLDLDNEKDPYGVADSLREVADAMDDAWRRRCLDLEYGRPTPGGSVCAVQVECERALAQEKTDG